MLRSKRLGRSTIQPCATATRKRFPRPLRNRQLESGSRVRYHESPRNRSGLAKPFRPYSLAQPQLESGSRFRYHESSRNRSGLAKPFRPHSLAPPQLESGSRVRYKTGNSKAVPASATMSRPVIVADWRSHFDLTALRHRNSFNFLIRKRCAGSSKIPAPSSGARG